MDGFISQQVLLSLLPIKSLKTLKAWGERGYGPPRVKLGPKRVGYRVEDVERFLASMGKPTPEDR